MLMTGSWDLSEGQAGTLDYGPSTYPDWLTFGTGLPIIGAALPNEPTESEIENTTYEIKFRGTNRIPTLTMMAYAEKGELNYSTNPTFLEPTTLTAAANSSSYSEPKRTIKNIQELLTMIRKIAESRFCKILITPVSVIWS